MHLANGLLRVTCRSCGRAELNPVLSLGNMPLANSLLSRDQLDEPEPRFPLDLVFCPACALAQITVTVPPEQLFSRYLYLSSYSDTMLAHARELTDRLCRERELSANSLVIEIASNDGYLLRNYVEAGIPVLGIEPAQNIASVAVERGVATLVEFFGVDCGRRLAAGGQRADIVHGHNVLAHVADLNGVVSGIVAVLKESGMAIIEVPYVGDLIERTEFDTIYHEHLCYFSLTSLDSLFARHGLRIVNVERIAIHGGSLRIFAAKAGTPEPAVGELLAEEKLAGLASIAYYSNFGVRVRRLRERLLATLAELKLSGCTIAAYGASAKGSTLLNFLGVGGETIDFVADRSPIKQGLFTPGTHLPIVPPEKLLEDKPDYALLLVWNFADEVLSQQRAYRDLGGRFIIPVPDVQIV
jgi:SAM-dependent methyltransferase